MYINGIKVFTNVNQFIFIIEDLTDDLKSLIRVQLSSICHGISDASSGRVAYQYQPTLKEFFQRYSSKPLPTKIGMLGELLSHVLFIQYFDNFDTVTPFFNSEERSIKKGFDIVLFEKSTKEIWITEVKTGQIHQGKNADETTQDLLGTAKYDLKLRLNENNVTLWKNAIIGVKTVLETFQDTKEAVKNILENIHDEVTANQANSNDKNVVLVSTLFNPLNDNLSENGVKEFAEKLRAEAVFKNEIVVAIQKGTFQKIEDFLRHEATQ